MTLRIALAAALLAASTGLAAAQTPPPPPPPGADAPPPPPGEMDAQRPDGEGGPGERGPRGGPHGGRGPGGPHGMHGKGYEQDGASFNLRMGPARLMVRCGDEALAACIEASRPLLDIVGSGPSALPRPPSSSLTLPPTPPAPGDIPTTIPGADAPPVSPAN